MNVCEDCGSEEIEYCDADDTIHYCSLCFMEITNEEFIKANRIEKISEHIKEWSRN